jgi:hypothetical protein
MKKTFSQNASCYLILAAISSDLLADEGYNFALQGYVPGDPNNEILDGGLNYTVPIVHQPRFPSVPLQDSFQVTGFGSAAYHYWSDVKDDADERVGSFAVHTGENLQRRLATITLQLVLF